MKFIFFNLLQVSTVVSGRFDTEVRYSSLFANLICDKLLSLSPKMHSCLSSFICQHCYFVCEHFSDDHALTLIHCMPC